MAGIWPPLLISLKVAFWATFFATTIGIAIAYALSRRHNLFSDLIDAVLTLPLVLPPTVIGYYLLVVFGRNSSFGAWLDSLGINLVFTWQGAVVAAAIVALPLVLKSARAAFAGVDIRYQQAAASLGAGPLGVFFRITLPLALKGIMAGVLLAFARALGEFGATLMIAGSIPGQTQTMSIAIYEAVQSGNSDQALILVALISVTCVFVLCAVAWLNKSITAG